MRLEGCCAIAGQSGPQHKIISGHLLLLLLAVLQLQGVHPLALALASDVLAHVTDTLKVLRRVGHPDDTAALLDVLKGLKFTVSALCCWKPAPQSHLPCQPPASNTWLLARSLPGRSRHMGRGGCVGSNPSTWGARDVLCRASGASGPARRRRQRAPRRLWAPERAPTVLRLTENHFSR